MQNAEIADVLEGTCRTPFRKPPPPCLYGDCGLVRAADELWWVISYVKHDLYGR